MEAVRSLRISDQRGFTLVELMVAMTAMIVVFLAALSLIDFAIKSQPQIAARNNSIEDAQVEMERLSRELRQSYSVVSASPTGLTVLTYLNRTSCGSNALGTARKCMVTYSCSAGVCTRTASEEDGTATGVTRTLVSGLTSDSIFSYTPDTTDPSSIDVTMSFAAPEGSGEDAITLTDGVTLRNLSGVGA